jgi:Flp pilus assembly protein CpaB
MATRFGAVTPTDTHKTKVLWIGAFLVATLAIVAVLIVVIWQTSDDPSNAIASTNLGAQDPSADATRIPVAFARVRIEEGTRLELHMFEQTPMDADKTPIAVIRWQDLNSVIGMYATRRINVDMPLVREDISQDAPLSSIKIPPGFRAVSILVDSRSRVEGFAKPGSRVDILWAYLQDGQQKVATIVRFVKVLSVAGATKADGDSTQVEGETTVTLLVSEKDAKKIELARTLGTISLSLVGDQEQGASSTEPDAITLNDLIGRPAMQEATEEPNDGEMFTVDPRTGREIRYVLRRGKWVRDSGFDEQ